MRGCHVSLLRGNAIWTLPSLWRCWRSWMHSATRMQCGVYILLEGTWGVNDLLNWPTWHRVHRLWVVVHRLSRLHLAGHSVWLLLRLAREPARLRLHGNWCWGCALGRPNSEKKEISIGIRDNESVKTYCSVPKTLQPAQLVWKVWRTPAFTHS